LGPKFQAGARFAGCLPLQQELDDLVFTNLKLKINPLQNKEEAGKDVVHVSDHYKNCGLWNMHFPTAHRRSASILRERFLSQFVANFNMRRTLAM
jgi:hypothetical protein